MNDRYCATALMAVALAALTGCGSDSKTTADASQVASHSNSVCLQTFNIDHTDILDDKSVLYYMKDNKVWLNSLPFACPSLKNEGGFAYANDYTEVCSSQGTIRVLRSGIICELGEFTPFTPPPMTRQQ